MINMFRFLQFSCAAVCVAIFSACGSNRAETLTSADDDVFFADPTIINLDGRYYLAGTQGSNPPRIHCIEFYRSAKLVSSFG